MPDEVPPQFFCIQRPAFFMVNTSSSDQVARAVMGKRRVIITDVITTFTALHDHPSIRASHYPHLSTLLLIPTVQKQSLLLLIPHSSPSLYAIQAADPLPPHSSLLLYAMQAADSLM